MFSLLSPLYSFSFNHVLLPLPFLSLWPHIFSITELPVYTMYFATFASTYPSAVVRDPTYFILDPLDHDKPLSDIGVDWSGNNTLASTSKSSLLMILLWVSCRLVLLTFSPTMLNSMVVCITIIAVQITQIKAADQCFTLSGLALHMHP